MFDRMNYYSNSFDILKLKQVYQFVQRIRFVFNFIDLFDQMVDVLIKKNKKKCITCSTVQFHRVFTSYFSSLCTRSYCMWSYCHVPGISSTTVGRPRVFFVPMLNVRGSVCSANWGRPMFFLLCIRSRVFTR